MPYLVDSDVLVDLTRGSIGAEDHELLAGAPTQRETASLDRVLSGYPAIPPNAEIARRAYTLMIAFARSHSLHALDELIAATAIQNGLTLVSKNRNGLRRHAAS